jgi:hypothetical protein
MSFEFALYDALLSIEVPTERARAVIDALEHDMGSTLATKQDVLLLRQDIEKGLKRLEEKSAADIELLRSSMTVRLGSMQVVTVGLLFAALKLT